MQHTLKKCNQTGGFIIEVLVAMVIFSIGIVGLLNMQSFANKAAAEATYRSEAAMLVNDYINRMWVADRRDATAFIGNHTPGGAAYQDWTWRGSDPTAAYSYTNPAPGSVFYLLPNSTDYPPEINVTGHGSQGGICTSDCSFLISVQVYWLAPSDKKPINGNNPNKEAYNTFQTTAHIGGQ
jgi:type IV pilus assembly protein PilV